MSISELFQGKSLKTIIILLSLQTLIFIVFAIRFFIKYNHNIRNTLYTCLSLILFLIFMIHFAYHSINNAYFEELVAFLVMSVISSTIITFNYLYYEILDDHEILVKMHIKYSFTL